MVCSSSSDSSRTLAASASVRPPCSRHSFKSFFMPSQVTASKYSPDNSPMTWLVSSPASFGASVSLSHSNKVMAVLMAMALSMYVFNSWYGFDIFSPSCPTVHDTGTVMGLETWLKRAPINMIPCDYTSIYMGSANLICKKMPSRFLLFFVSTH